MENTRKMENWCWNIDSSHVVFSLKFYLNETFFFIILSHWWSKAGSKIANAKMSVLLYSAFNATLHSIVQKKKEPRMAIRDPREKMRSLIIPKVLCSPTRYSWEVSIGNTKKKDFGFSIVWSFSHRGQCFIRICCWNLIKLLFNGRQNLRIKMVAIRKSNYKITKC